MSLNADGTLVVPKDEIIVWEVNQTEKRVRFLIDDVEIIFEKNSDGKIVKTYQDGKFIPRDKFIKAVKKAYAILK